MTARFRRCRILWVAAALLVGPTAIVTLAAPVGAGSSVGAVYHVAPGGSDGASGAVGAPWRTLGHALVRLGPGDTLVVAEGEYVERVGGKGSGGFVSLTPGTATAPVVVRAAAGATPTLRGLLWVEGMDRWTFDGLDVTWDDATGQADEHMVRLKNGVGWTFENAEIWGARSYANVNVLSDVPSEPADWVLRGNCIRDNLGDPGHGTARDQLLYVNTGLGAGAGVIERNLIFGAPRGKAVKVAGPSAGTGSTNVTVRYNTIVDTYKPPVNLAWDTSNSLIHHNLIGETAEPNKGLVRGYELVGTGNRTHDNYGWAAERFVFVDGASTATVSSSADTLGADPGFDRRGCDGFRPTNPAAQAYGRYAPSTGGLPADGDLPRYDRDGPQGTVYRLYRAYFLREPDVGGYQYWLAGHRGGHSLHDISSDFSRSLEFSLRYGVLSDGAFLELVYQNVLGRRPDPGGHAYWLDRMTRGMPRGHVMVGFSESTEFRQTTAGGVPIGYRT